VLTSMSVGRTVPSRAMSVLLRALWRSERWADGGSSDEAMATKYGKVVEVIKQ